MAEISYKIDMPAALVEKQKEKADKDYEECNLKVNGITGKCTELYKRKVNEKEKLYEVLQEENFLNINEVKENVLNKNKIEELKLLINPFILRRLKKRKKKKIN